MNFAKYYFIGVLVAIAALVASTFWQYQQFQSNIRNINLSLPPQISSAMPNANDQLNQMMKQAQEEMQKQTRQEQSPEQNQPQVETKKYTAPDESFSFDYPADWQETPDQQIDDVDGKIIFYATKITNTGLMPTTSILAVKESTAKTAQEAIDWLKKDARSKGSAVKFTQSDLITGVQTLPLIEMEFTAKEPIMSMAISSMAKNIIINAKRKIYLITILTQGDNLNIGEQEKILDSIKANS